MRRASRAHRKLQTESGALRERARHCAGHWQTEGLLDGNVRRIFAPHMFVACGAGPFVPSGALPLHAPTLLAVFLQCMPAAEAEYA